MGSVYRPNGRNIWMIKWRGLDGRRYVESSGSTKKTVAQKLLREKEHLTDQGVLVTPDVGKLTFEEAVTILVNFHKTRRRNTKKMESRIAKHLRPYFGAARPMATITGASVSAYIVKRQADVRVIPAREKRTRNGIVHIPERRKPTADATINRELAWLKQMFKLAIEQGKLLTMPKITLLREDNARQGFLEDDQIAAVLSHLNEDVRAPVHAAAITGWRLKSEILSRQWRHVDWKEGKLSLFKGEAKNKEPRDFYFSLAPELRSLLEQQLAEHERLKRRGRVVPWIFHRDGKPIVILTKAFKGACRKAGYPGFIPHDLRRSAVRRLTRQGVPENVAMKITGHKTRAVFDRYNIVNDADVRDACARIGQVKLAR